jgi:signal transduction histidine kinase
MNFDSKKNHQSVLDISQIVHDLKNPLTTIIASIDFLKNGKVSGKDRQQLHDMIENESKNILNFINDIIEISKIEHESQVRSDKKYNIALTTDKILKNLEPLSRQRNIKIEVNVQKDLDTNVHEIRVKQILSNLISNSIKYNKKDGKIIINLYQKTILYT